MLNFSILTTHLNSTLMNVEILAAGMGNRMQSALPKVLHPLAGKPLLSHVIDTARGLSPGRLCVIYGHGGAAVLDLLAKQSEPVSTALQEPQLGTGHAVMQALPELDDSVPTLILYGDVPLTTAASLRRLVDAAGSDQLGILTVVQDDPYGLGRIVRENGDIVAIVEEKDATDAQRAIKEINSGIMVAPTAHLKRWLAALSNNNAQGVLPDRHRGPGRQRRRARRVGPARRTVGSGWRQQQGAVGPARAHSSGQYRAGAAGAWRHAGGPGAHRRARRADLRTRRQHRCRLRV